MAHRAWDNYHFALKPIAESPRKTMLTVEFYWLRAPGHSSMNRSEFITKPNFPSNLPSGKTEVNLYHNDRGTPFRSGDSITLQTNEPHVLPLPSFKLLTLQWHLSRLASMAGATDMMDDDDDDGDGRDDWGLIG